MNITLAGGAATYAPDDDQLGRVSLEFAAFDGEVGIGQLPIPDTAAAISIQTGRQARVDEIGTLLVDGFIIDNDRIRGPIPAASATPSTTREYTFSVEDPNALLFGFRVERNSPSQTDRARVLAWAAADLPTFDTTWVLNTNTLTMPPKKYQSDGWLDLITDVVEFTGKTLFVHDKAAGGRCLHYHSFTEGHTCGLSISDVVADYNGTTVFKPGQPSRQTTAVDLVNNVKGRDQANRTAQYSDAASIAAHNADGRRHEVFVDFEADSQEDLNAKTLAFLGSQRYDLVTYLADIGPLDATALSKIRVGDLMPVTSTVLGLTASSQRIAHMTLTPWSGRDGPPEPDLWNAHLELGAPIRRRGRIKKAPAVKHELPPNDPWTPGGGECHAVNENFSADQSPLVTSDLGGWTYAFEDSGTSTPVPPELVIASGGAAVITHNNDFVIGSTLTFTNPLVWPWKVTVFFTLPLLVPVVGGGPGGNSDLAFARFIVSAATVNGNTDGSNVGYGSNINDVLGPAFNYVGQVDSHSAILGANGTGNSITGTIVIHAEDNGVIFITVSAGGFSVAEYDSGRTTTADLSSILFQTEVLNNGSKVIRIDGIDILTSEGCVGEPAPGQSVIGEFIAVGDGATTAYTTRFPYIAGTLRVYVNDGREFDVSESGPSTGDFAFFTAPFVGEAIRVDYQAA